MILHGERITVLCGIAQFDIIVPYFSQEDGDTMTVNSQHYMREFLFPELRRHLIALHKGLVSTRWDYFHTSGEFMDFLREYFIM